MSVGPDAEDLVSKSLPDPLDSLEIEQHLFKLFKPLQQPLCL